MASFRDWTQAQVDAYHAKLGKPAGQAPNAPPAALPPAMPPDVSMSIQESKVISSLNKTERKFYRHLQMLGVNHIYVQSITLLLADMCRFTIDFVHIDENGRLIATDVKGYQRDDALVKIKVAARMYPFIRFRTAKLVNGSWEYRDFSP